MGKIYLEKQTEEFFDCENSMNSNDIYTHRMEKIRETKDIFILKELAESKDLQIKNSVAGNPNTPSDVLKELAKDERLALRRIVAGNPNTPSDVLKELAKEKDSQWPSEIFYDFADPKVESILDSLTNGQQVRQTVAGNPNTPKETLIELSKEKDQGMKIELAGNPNTPKEILIE